TAERRPVPSSSTARRCPLSNRGRACATGWCCASHAKRPVPVSSCGASTCRATHLARRHSSRSPADRTTPGGTMATTTTTQSALRWGADSEYGVLTDVLLGPADNFRWLPTSSISKATLASGAVFDHDLAMRQHAEMVDAYRDAGVAVHTLAADPALPYQVYARDSSFMTPLGAVVTQMAQWWRRGEYAPVIRFYQDSGIPIF